MARSRAGGKGTKGRRAPTGDPQALFRRAVADYEAGRHRQARKALAPLLDLPDSEGYVTLLTGLVDAALGDWKAAEKRLVAAVERLPQRVEAWMGLGNVRQMLGDPVAAAAAFRRALDLQPDNAAAWNNLGIARADVRLDHDAIACFERALELAPDHDEAARGRAEALARMARFEEAQTAYEELLRRHPDDAGLALARADLLERANRGDEALAALPAADNLKQPALIARREALRARLLMRGGDLDGALEVVRAARRRTREDWLGCLEGRLLDRLDQPDTAMQAFGRGNAALMRTPAYRRLHRQRLPEYLDHKIAQGIKPCDGNVAADTERTPVLIVGLPRSGTTLLDRMLDAHPDIQVLEEPESMRMAETVIAAGGSMGDARERYWRYLDETIGLDPGKLVVDKNPLHALHLDQLPALFPSATVILSLRHPYDAALSCYMQEFSLNPATVHFLEPESTAGLCARLLRMMELFEQACPERVQRVHYETLVAGDFRAPLERLLESIGLSWHPDIEDFTAKAAGSGLIKSASYEQVTRGLYTSAVERWRRYEAWLEPFRRELGPMLEYWGYEE